jgi:hypothetical protein
VVQGSVRTSKNGEQRQITLNSDLSQTDYPNTAQVSTKQTSEKKWLTSSSQQNTLPKVEKAVIKGETSLADSVEIRSKAMSREEAVAAASSRGILSVKDQKTEDSASQASAYPIKTKALDNLPYLNKNDLRQVKARQHTVRQIEKQQLNSSRSNKRVPRAFADKVSSVSPSRSPEHSGIVQYKRKNGVGGSQRRGVIIN